MALKVTLSRSALQEHFRKKSAEFRLWATRWDDVGSYVGTIKGEITQQHGLLRANELRQMAAEMDFFAQHLSKGPFTFAVSDPELGHLGLFYDPSKYGSHSIPVLPGAKAVVSDPNPNEWTTEDD